MAQHSISVDFSRAARGPAARRAQPLAPGHPAGADHRAGRHGGTAGDRRDGRAAHDVLHRGRRRRGQLPPGTHPMTGSAVRQWRRARRPARGPHRRHRQFARPASGSRRRSPDRGSCGPSSPSRCWSGGRSTAATRSRRTCPGSASAISPSPASSASPRRPSCCAPRPPARPSCSPAAARSTRREPAEAIPGDPAVASRGAAHDPAPGNRREPGHPPADQGHDRADPGRGARRAAVLRRLPLRPGRRRGLRHRHRDRRQPARG